MLKVCDGCKDGLDTDQDGSSVSTKWAENGAALAPFRANGAYPSTIHGYYRSLKPRPSLSQSV